MPHWRFFFIGCWLCFFSCTSLAAIYTGITFSQQEKLLHLEQIEEITQEAANCLRDTYDAQAEDRQLAPKNPLNVWGYHQARYQSVRTTGVYLYNQVDDARHLVNFGTTTPPFLQKIRFAIGTAHGGYHVFLITEGETVEAHAGAPQNAIARGLSSCHRPRKVKYHCFHRPLTIMIT